MVNKLTKNNQHTLAAIAIALCTQTAIVSVTALSTLGLVNTADIDTLNRTTAIFTAASILGSTAVVASSYAYLRLHPRTWWPDTEEQGIRAEIPSHSVRLDPIHTVLALETELTPSI